MQKARGPKGETILLTHDGLGRVVERRIERRGFRPTILKLKWNARNQLIEARSPDGSGWRYGYDPLGRRVFKEHFVTPANDDGGRLSKGNAGSRAADHARTLGHGSRGAGYRGFMQTVINTVGVEGAFLMEAGIIAVQFPGKYNEALAEAGAYTACLSAAGVI